MTPPVQPSQEREQTGVFFFFPVKGRPKACGRCGKAILPGDLEAYRPPGMGYGKEGPHAAPLTLCCPCFDAGPPPRAVPA